MAEEKTTYEILEEIAATTKRNEKLQLLEAVKGTKIEPFFKKVLWLAYDPSVDFYIKEFEEAKETDEAFQYLGDAISDLENVIAKRVFTGNQAKLLVEQAYEGLSPEDREVYKRVLRRDLRCGISATTINKVWPEMIYIHPYMRCSSFSEKNLKNISFPCYSQLKMDGLYCDIIITEDSVEYRSRYGQLLNVNLPERDQQLIDAYAGFVLQGEFIAVEEDDHTKLMDRSRSNGYLNSNDIDPTRLRFFVWDMITDEDFQSWETGEYNEYTHRFEYFQKTFTSDFGGFLNIVDSRVVDSKEEIIDHFREVREAGEEGLVLKDVSLQWKNGTSKKQVKVKVIFDCDLKLVGWKEGEGRHEGKLGSLLFETDDGGIHVSVGTGYKDDERDEWWDEEILQSWVDSGKIACIRANDVTVTEEGKSLFLPRFVEFRSDKVEADSTERVEEQVKAFTDALELIKG